MVEPLDRRVLLAATATLAGGTLFVTGDEQDNVITVSRDAGGTIFVNNGAVAITGGPATLGNTHHLHLVGAGGNDIVALDETNGPLPGAAMFGGAGNDLLAGGTGVDFADGGAGADSVFLGGGDDTFQWNPGDGSDLVEGQGGSDDVVFNATVDAERVTLTSNVNRVLLTRDAGGITIDFDDVETVSVNTGHFADVITVGDLSATDVSALNLNIDPDPQNQPGGAAVDRIDIDGTAGNDNVQFVRVAGGFFVTGLHAQVNVDGISADNDVVFVRALGGNDVVNAGNIPANVMLMVIDGGSGNDSLRGSQGNDAIIGGAGDDVALLEGGDDAFLWNPGDGNDTVEGKAGRDQVAFNGSGLAEQFHVSTTSADHVRVARDLESVTADLAGVERLDLNPLGGADIVTVHDLSGGEVDEINLNLAGTAGGNAGDARPDSVIVHGSSADELIPVLGDSGGILVNGDFLSPNGLPYFMLIRAVEPTDFLRVNGNGGNDTIAADTLATPVIFSADGGAGNDTLRGSAAGDLIFAGSGNDEIDGNGGGDAVTVTAGTAALAATQKLSELTIGAGGVLDLRTHSLILDYGDADASPIGTFDGSAYTGVTGLIQRGAILSSAASDITGVGVAEAADVAPDGVFAGQSVDATAVLLKYTYAGDANLDGRVTGDDYGTIDFAILVPGARGYFNGDFNLDGVINGDDYGVIDFTILAQGPPL